VTASFTSPPLRCGQTTASAVRGMELMVTLRDVAAGSGAVDLHQGSEPTTRQCSCSASGLVVVPAHVLRKPNSEVPRWFTQTSLHGILRCRQTSASAVSRTEFAATPRREAAAPEAADLHEGTARATCRRLCRARALVVGRGRCRPVCADPGLDGVDARCAIAPTL